MISVARLSAGDPLIFNRSPQGLGKVFTDKEPNTVAWFTPFAFSENKVD